MNSIKKIFLLLFVYGSIAGQSCLPPVANQRDLIILPDTAGEESIELLGKNAVNMFQSGHLETALQAQAAPILVELSIWKRFARLVKDKKKSALSAIACDYYKINNYLLCVPRAAQQQTPISSFDLKNAQKVAKPFEMIPTIFDPLKGVVKATLLLVEVYSSVVKTLQQLLVHPKGAANHWNIVLFGHGGPAPIGSHTARVAGIPFREFKKLLQFLNSSIKTNIFLYQTCYAGSKWLLKSYETNGKPNKYNFPIILTGISEAPVYSFGGYRDSSIFKQFFAKIKTTQLCPENIQKLGAIAGVLLQAVTYKKIKNQLALTRPNNIVQIRWPNTTRFETIELDTLVLTASTLAEQSQEQPEQSRSFALVLDKPVIQKEILLTKGERHIASAIAQKAHYISSLAIEGTFTSINDLMKQVYSYFTEMKKLKKSKLFLIDRVYNSSNPSLSAHNVMMLINMPTPSTILFLKTTELFYQVGAQGWRWKLDAPAPEKIDRSKTEKYVALFKTEKKKLV